MDQPRTIERSRDDRVLFGVCGGIARAFDFDPTVIRVVAVILVALGGLGLVAYVVAALLLPEEDGGRPIVDLGIGERDRKTTTIGLIVLAAVVLLLAGDPWPFDGRGLGGGIVVVAIVVAVALLVYDRRRRDGEPRPRNYSADMPSTTAEAPTARAADTRPLPALATTPESPTAETRVIPPESTPSRRGAGLVAWGLALIVVAAAAAMAPIGDAEWGIFAAAAVIAVGAVLVLVSPWGGSPSLVVCGFLLAGGVGVAAASDISFEGGAGERIYRPADLADLRTDYQLGAGSMTLDLSNLELPPGTTTVEADVGFGELLVDVPADVEVEATGTANAGEVVLFGERNDGFDVDNRRTEPGDDDSRLVLDLHVGFGHLDVSRPTP